VVSAEGKKKLRSTLIIRRKAININSPHALQGYGDKQVGYEL